ncbi:CheR family methyltransferase [Chryseosolibacter indicus]|uniref:protein-glutamate O-methyltransferase n=1 Tax=Chryseosolibacter indicus TaxID=2782351 RepID=A0ABS5VWF2_9BACT|nr:CheR family methyltransferase [Chryseosolibacter indicus]MBT1705064.1 methyltransferase [Chryseosolibacter indicus]
MIESAPLSVKLTTSEFARISSFIYKECGINLSPAKRVLVESRLQKRLAHFKFTSFTAYCDYVMGVGGKKEELVNMIDAVATNKTDFFREPVHFQFMENEALPSFTEEGSSRCFKIWSSACSTGEEPYTIAMVMEEFCLQHRIDYRITATDISTKALRKAAEAIYADRTISDVPMGLRKRYLLKSKDTENPTVRFIPRLRSKVQYKRLNLMDDVLDVDYDFDIVFCRNVLIYFDRKTQEAVVNKLLSHLRPGGYLFIGHSESIYQMKLPVTQIRPTIFQKI